MSLNKFMHPRNKYKNKKPSFLELALKYPDFRKQVTQDESGKVFLDFKNADALRALTTCLLKEDFDLAVHLPSDRLVPTLPLRLNYLHWLEDIVGTESGKWGIDVGTGASCVYPLLAAKTQSWNFLATEADPENFFHAQKNVEANNLTEKIHLKQVSVDDILIDPVDSFKHVNTFNFCMCNPPFFVDHMEAQAVSTTRSVDRPEAHSMSTASPQECIVKGGEVGFIRQMIEESTILKDKIRVYSSMVGKKASLAQLKKELRQQNIPKFATTDFCQGKTMRWGIAWSFDPSVNFPKSQFEGKKEKKPLQYVIPEGSGGVSYNVHSIASFLKDVLSSIKVHCYQGKIAKSYTSITLTATENTWCHQRRRRRQQRRQEQEVALKGDNDNKTEIASPSELSDNNNVSKKNDSFSTETNQNLTIGEQSMIDTCEDSSEEGSKSKDGCVESSRKRSIMDDGFDHDPKPVKLARTNEDYDDDDALNKAENGINERDKKLGAETNMKMTREKTDDSGELDIREPATLADNEGVNVLQTNSDDVGDKESPKEYIVKCVMRLKRAGDVINMELEHLGGVSRELTHQIKTFLINKLGELERLPE